MRFLLVFILAFGLSACASLASSTSPASPEDEPSRAEYPDLGAAPELVGDAWLNTSSPLRLADLRGKVVLVDMWTFG
jgi:hypothetical protein